MSVLSIISYDIYDNIPIVIKNKLDREYYFIDFTLDNVKEKISKKPTKYFDDVDDLHHDYFIINGVKKIWNKYSPEFNNPYHFKNEIYNPTTNIQFTNVYKLRDFILRILKIFNNIPELKFYIIDNDNNALEFSDTIPISSHSRSRILIEYYSKNTLRFIHTINNEVAKELQNYKSDTIKKYITCDVDYFDINDVLKEYSLYKYNDKIYLFGLNYNTSSKLYNFYNNCDYNIKNIYYNSISKNFNNVTSNNQLYNLNKYISSKIIYDRFFNQMNCITNKITYQQNDDDYWSLKCIKQKIINNTSNEIDKSIVKSEDKSEDKSNEIDKSIVKSEDILLLRVLIDKLENQLNEKDVEIKIMKTKIEKQTKIITKLTTLD